MENIDLSVAIFIEVFVTIHMSIFVFWPMSKIISPKDSDKIFITLFIFRAITLVIFDIFISASIAMFDFFMVFFGAFIIVPLSALISTRIRKKNGTYNKNDGIFTVKTKVFNHTSIVKYCPSCNSKISENAKYCSNCGVKIIKDCEIEPNNLNSNPIKENYKSKW